MFWWAERMVKTVLRNIDPGTRLFLHTQTRLGGVLLILSATSDMGGLFSLMEMLANCCGGEKTCSF
jgi:uncharacterized protein YidB (DUF937 family)